MAETTRKSAPLLFAGVLLFFLGLLVLGFGLGVLGATPAASKFPVPASSFIPGSAISASSVYYDMASAISNNTGVEAEIQVQSFSVPSGVCVAYWVSDDSSASVWGQTGYFICSGSTPVGFFQIWDLPSTDVTTTEWTVTTGYHFFSMYDVPGTDTWDFAMDGQVEGSYDLGAPSSSTSYPVYSGSESYENMALPQVSIPVAMMVQQGGAWVAQSSAALYDQSATWGIEGNAQSSSIPVNALIIGGSASQPSSGAQLWGAPASSSTTVTYTQTVTNTLTDTQTSTVTNTAASTSVIRSTVTSTVLSTSTATSTLVVTQPTTQTLTQTSTTVVPVTSTSVVSSTSIATVTSTSVATSTSVTTETSTVTSTTVKSTSPPPQGIDPEVTAAGSVLSVLGLAMVVRSGGWR